MVEEAGGVNQYTEQWSYIYRYELFFALGFGFFEYLSFLPERTGLGEEHT